VQGLFFRCGNVILIDSGETGIKSSNQNCAGSNPNKV
jgi:hypothetical protein